MDKEQLALKSFRLQNFKAVRDSGVVEFTPLTVFIGNNGSGKSSLIEGLEMIQLIVEHGLDRAMQQWHGFEQIWNQSVPHQPIGLDGTETSQEEEEPIEAMLLPIPDDETDEEDGADDPGPEDLPPDDDPRRYDLITGNVEDDPTGEPKSSSAEIPPRPYLSNPMTFSFQCCTENPYSQFGYAMKVTTEPNGEGLMFQEETLRAVVGDTVFFLIRNSTSQVNDLLNNESRPILEDISYLSDAIELMGDRYIAEFIESWQFLLLDPAEMGELIPQKRTKGKVKLAKNGANIAEYLKSIYELDKNAFNGIVETLKVVLPYAGDLQPGLTSELERNVYLQLVEGEARLPGWLLSTGTLRIIAILAVLRHPEPPPLLVIEELENGLDPRTIHLIIQEIKRVTATGQTQVILTTHSPYLLDLLRLEEIILVQREGGQPVFWRPAEDEQLQEWTERFAPGRLYAMGRLNRQTV